MTAVTDFGPVATIHYNPTYQQTATVEGISLVRLGGSMALAAAQALFTLVNNLGNRTTRDGHTGVLATITSPYAVIAPFNGLYIMKSFDFVPYQFNAGTIAADFALAAAYLGAAA